jgi:hypothetical protein
MLAVLWLEMAFAGLSLALFGDTTQELGVTLTGLFAFGVSLFLMGRATKKTFRETSQD